MYKTFFGLKRRPFLLAPDPESYFSIDSMEEARQMVERTLQKGEGISLIFGAAGTGKTLLLRILRQSQRSESASVLVSNSRLETPKALFLQLAHDLHISPTGNEVVELRSQILDFVRQESTNASAKQAVLLLFDDAQYLSLSVLEEIRLLSDSIDGSNPPFRAVLAGTMELEETLTLPSLEAFNQRVVSRCYLDSFSGAETSRYIVWQTDDIRIDPPHSATVAQSRLPLFTEEAQRRIYQLTGGVPRLINQLCGTALQFAAERGMQRVDGALINDAWINFQHLEPVSETEEQNSSVVQETVISQEARQTQIDETVDRKRKTFQFRQFDSVEFGTLTDTDSDSRPFHGNEYKPPYPEDDDEESITSNAETGQPDLQTGIDHLIGSPKLPEGSVRLFVPDETVVVPRMGFPKRRLVPNAFRQHRKFRRRYLSEKIQHRLGLFACLLPKEEPPQVVRCNHESDMDAQSLQEYGAVVLEGRPPFVRQEPHYAYQTTETARLRDMPYPDPKTGIPITLRWFSENTDKTERFGVSYTEFLNREHLADTPVSTDTPPPQNDPVFRTSLHASLGNPVTLAPCSGLEEVFEESHQVGGLAVSLAELFRSNPSMLQQLEGSPELNNLDEVVQRQLETVVKRLIKAAEKIEQAAEVSERAGQHVSRAAELVETEVKTALPTYAELFKRLSDFQEMITAELDTVRLRDATPPKFNTFPPRRQVVIERSIPTINVETLLR